MKQAICILKSVFFLLLINMFRITGALSPLQSLILSHIHQKISEVFDSFYVKFFSQPVPAYFYATD